MTNLCEGTLKIRGAKEDICKFIENELVLYNNPYNLDERLHFQKTTETSYIICYQIYGDDIQYVNFNDSLTYYIREQHVTINNNNDGVNWRTNVTLVGRGNTKAEYLAELSKQYNLDFKIYAFERGCEFNRDIEVHKGEIIKDEVINFEDYDWECICPTIGG